MNDRQPRLRAPFLWPALLIASVAFGLWSCAQRVPPEALELTAESLQDRELGSRRFDTDDEAMLLTASAALLQDLGYNLDESEPELGVLVGSKTRSAVEAGQVMLKIIGLLGGANIPIDTRQLIRASIVTSPTGESRKSIRVRVTFQRIVWNDANTISKLERIREPEIYQEFFAKLSKSVFLTAHEI